LHGAEGSIVVVGSLAIVSGDVSGGRVFGIGTGVGTGVGDGVGAFVGQTLQFPPQSTLVFFEKKNKQKSFKMQQQMALYCYPVSLPFLILSVQLPEHQI
jgi:hypothetical protein